MPETPLVILNRNAGRGAGARSEGRIREALPGAEIWLTEGRGHGTELARKAAADGRETVLAAGGDGTINEVLNGLDLERMVFGLIPVGTGNDLGRHAGIRSLTDSVDALKARRFVKADVGHIRLDTGESRLFINVSGCGFDAAVAQSINRGYRFLTGPAAYVAALTANLATFQPPLLNVVDSSGREVLNERAMLCSIANSSSYGGGMLVAPRASLVDGQLDVVAVRQMSRLRFLRKFPVVFRGGHLDMPEVVFSLAPGLRVHSDPPMPLLVDGETWGQTPATIDLLPGAVRLLAGRQEGL